MHALFQTGVCARTTYSLNTDGSRDKKDRQMILDTNPGRTGGPDQGAYKYRIWLILVEEEAVEI